MGTFVHVDFSFSPDLSPAVFINGLMMVMSSCRHNAAGPKRVVDEVQSGTPEGQWV